MKPGVNIFQTEEEISLNLAIRFINDLSGMLQKQNKVTIALSGGNTPLSLYKRIATQNSVNKGKVDWSKVHYFWGDERCVPPAHDDSNYRMAWQSFIRSLGIPTENVHRIMGESAPEEEIVRYSKEMVDNVPMRNNVPCFDWCFLGIGADGHIASIFPDRMDLMYSSKFCDITRHPETKQNRITLTGKVLINSRRITYLVIGDNKKEIIKAIFNNNPEAKTFLAYFIKAIGGTTEWYLDKKAAQLINDSANSMTLDENKHS